MFDFDIVIYLPIYKADSLFPDLDRRVLNSHSSDFIHDSFFSFLCRAE